MKVVIEIKPTYLEKTESWLWEYLKNLKSYNPLLVCEEIKNLDLFPLDDIVQLEKPVIAERLFGGVVRAFVPRHIAIERAVAKKIKQINSALIHAHYGPNGVYAIPLARKFNIPLVTSFYGFDTSILAVSQRMRKIQFPWEQVYWRNAYQDLWKYGSFFTATCQKMKNDLIALGAPEEKINILHLGVDINKYKIESKKATKSPVLLIANRFVAKKGTEYAIEAFAKILKSYPDCKLRIIGDGPNKESILSQISNLGIVNSVSMLGLLSYENYMKEMKCADIFLSPSVKVAGDEEGGINTTVIEAMAVGTCVFATEESGSELVFDKVTGYLVSQGNSEQLSEKIISYVKSPSMWNTIAINARKHIEKEFDSIKQTRKLENIYSQVIKKK
jgi:colanic acid/amylovoran biosynthesis glycosyltransferase